MLVNLHSNTDFTFNCTEITFKGAQYPVLVSQERACLSVECLVLASSSLKWIQITLVLVFIISRYWFKSIIRVPPGPPGEQPPEIGIIFLRNAGK